MNVVGFLGLLRTIYGKNLPDLEKIQDKGLLAVKIAQHYALRIDFLDEKVCRHLSQLYRGTIPLPAENVRALLEESAPPSWMDQFSSFADAPLASASVGQVHSAVLDDGTPVVVKLIKSDFSSDFLKDVRRIRRFLKFILFFYPKLRKVFDPLGVLRYIENYTLTELDLTNEIEGRDKLAGLRDRYKDIYPLDKMAFPKTFPHLSNEKILVSEFLDFPTFDELLDKGELAYETLLELFSIHGFFLFGPGIFHGDIHPGNLFLSPEGRIFFIDNGALSEAGERIRRGLFRFFQALAHYDYKLCAQRVHEMAGSPLSSQDYQGYLDRFLALYDDFERKTVSQVSLTKKMMDTIKLAVHSGMEFEQGMFAIIKGLMYMDGMVLRCRPDAVLMEDMRPFVNRFEKALESLP